MTVVDAWNLWPLWRWLVWAALGMTALAFAIPGSGSPPQTVVALPPLPMPSYQPPPTVQPVATPPAASLPTPAAKRPKSVPAVPLAVEAESPQPARPIVIPEGLPQPAQERQPGTYNTDPRLLKPRPLVMP